MRCIVADGMIACPSGFTFARFVGFGATITSCVCAACNMIGGKACTGNVQVFDSVDCTNAGRSYPGDGSCSTDNGYNSVKYIADPPPMPQCTPSAPSPGNGAATLTGVMTVCCR